MGNNRRGGRKLAFVAVLLAVALVVLAYVFLTGEPEGPDAPIASTPAQERAPAADLPLPESALANENNGPTDNPTATQPEWETSTNGDRTLFSLIYGDIGYVDVASILEDRDPYSIVALLRSHQELTGADESIEIAINWAGENERWGYEAVFEQIIEGQPAGKIGTILFSSSGAVGALDGNIVNFKTLGAGNILILQPEAEAIAHEAALRYAANLPDMPISRGQTLTTEVLPGEIRYELDSDNRLGRIWRIPVRITGPDINMDIAEVSISPETGDILDIQSGRIEQTSSEKKSPCDNVTFRMCNAEGTEKTSCAGVTAALEEKHQSARQIAANVITRVAAASSVHIARPQGFSCEIDIIMDQKLTGAKGAYYARDDLIVISSDASADEYESVISHEIFHALSQTPAGPVEHGMVYAMEALYLGGDDSEHWTTPTYTDFTEDPEDILNAGRTLEPSHEYAHTIYRVFKKVGRDKAFRLVFGIDQRRPADRDSFDAAIRTVGNQMGIGERITAILEPVPTLSEVLAVAREKFINGDYSDDPDPVGKALRVEYGRIQELMNEGGYGAADKKKFEQLLEDIAEVLGAYYAALHMQYEDEPGSYRPIWPNWPNWPALPGDD